MKIKGMDMRLMLAGLAGAALMAGCLLPNDSSKTQSNALALRGGEGDSASLHGKGAGHDGKGDDSAKEDDKDEGAKGGDFKVVICHIPPGNPGNAHTISVGAPAVKAHLAHGDHLGKCADSGPATHPCKDTGMSMEVVHGKGHGKEFDRDHGNPFKVVICHIPPGNPANAHTISVGAPAVKAHLAHGDHLGACSETAVDTTLATDCGSTGGTGGNGGNGGTTPPDTGSHNPPTVTPPTDTVIQDTPPTLDTTHTTTPPPTDTTHTPVDTSAT